MKTITTADELLLAIDAFETALYDSADMCIPDELASLYLTYLIEKDAFYRDIVIHKLTEFAETIPESAHEYIFNEFKNLVKKTLQYATYAIDSNRQIAKIAVVLS